jgi:PAS domain S-box-containing protein/putative nucleotidyltransferase with HDIG domain
MQASFEDITMRKRADDALRESEDRYRSLVDNIPEIIFTIDLQGKLTFVSRQAKEILGYESAEAINMSVLAFVPEEEHQRVTEGIRRGMAGEKLQHLQVPMTKKSGERVLFECSFTRVYQAGRVIGAQGTAVDITERKRAEAARALNSQRVQALLQLNQMAAATLQEITDFALEEAVRLTQSKIGYLAFLNEDESALTMHSWSKSAMAECAIAEKPIVYPVLSTGLWGEAVRQRRPVITNDYAAADPRKKGYPQGHVALTRHMNTPVFDGSRIVIVAGVGNKTEEYDQSDIQQLALLMEGMWRLIQRKHAQEALRDSEVRYRTLFEHSADGILIADLETKGFKYANPAVCRMLGYTAEEMRTIGVADIHPKDALPHVVTEFEAQTRGEKALATDLPCLRKDGTLLYADVNATTVAIDGRPCLVGFFRDTTGRKRMQEALIRSLEATLSVLSLTAEMRDPYTAGHQRRVTELAIALARKLGFPHDECDTLRIAGLLHDIGKLGIPAEILSKPSVLSPIEFELVRTHPQAAYEILAGATFPDLVAKIVLQHHERVDGSGYPKKISGDDILPEARILAVADVVEAMASHRPYRPALGIEAALAEIRAGRGTRYDQQVADACVALFESGEFSFQPASAG